jgi:hypothetical protein
VPGSFLAGFFVEVVRLVFSIATDLVFCVAEIFLPIPNWGPARIITPAMNTKVKTMSRTVELTISNFDVPL